MHKLFFIAPLLVVLGLGCTPNGTERNPAAPPTPVTSTVAAPTSSTTVVPVKKTPARSAAKTTAKPSSTMDMSSPSGVAPAPTVPESVVVTPPSTTPAPTPATVQVAIRNYAFAPGEITVAPGTVVTWTNLDNSPHTVTGKDFNSGTLAIDATYSHTFSEPGRYPYVCSFHSFMTGVIIVK